MERRGFPSAGSTATRRRPLPKKEGKAKSGVKKKDRTRILIVEEDQLLRGLFTQMLSGKGYQVEDAETATEAHERAKGRIYHMIIAGPSDGETGRMIQTLRKAVPGACIVILEEPSGARSLKGGDRTGADLVFPRPIDMTSALHRISEALAGRAR